jgi:drug/metabolite transporter (DMT)-like permease
VLIGILFALLAMVLNSAGALAAGEAARKATKSRPLAVQPFYLGGLFIDLISWLCSAAALRELPVFAVQAVIGGSIAITAVLGARRVGARLDTTTRFGVAASLLGLVIVASSAGEGRSAVSSNVVDIVLIALVLVLGVAVLVLRQFRHAWPLAIIAGVGFGGSALAVRAAHVEITAEFSPAALLAQPALYLVAGFWVVGIIGYSAAIGRGDIGSVTAVFIVTNVVVPGLIGIVLLGDPVRAGFAWVLVIGLAIAVTGVVVVARRPPPRPTHSRVR